MKNLLYKELRLVTHPTTLIFFALSAMLLIPNYPYYITFFYASLGLFFCCLTGRENHDIDYTVSLPVGKRELVRARIVFAVGVELVQLLIAVPFACLRNAYPPEINNLVGMEANVAFFGLSFLMLGLFNYFFFVSYYKHPDKVGRAFLAGSVAEGVFLIVAEAATHVVPFMRDRLDTKDPQFLSAKLLVLAGGILLFALLTGMACRRAEKSFEALDL